MEEYRRRLEKDIVWYKVIFVVFLVLAIGAMFSKLKWGSGIGGGFLAACINAALKINENRKSLKDEEKLKKQYIENSDERLEKIRLEGSRMTLGIVLIVLSIAIVVLLYVQALTPVLYTLIAVELLMIVVLLIANAVYSRLM